VSGCEAGGALVTKKASTSWRFTSMGRGVAVGHGDKPEIRRVAVEGVVGEGAAIGNS
jgi:hypothetical protein